MDNDQKQPNEKMKQMFRQFKPGMRKSPMFQPMRLMPKKMAGGCASGKCGMSRPVINQPKNENDGKE